MVELDKRQQAQDQGFGAGLPPVVIRKALESDLREIEWEGTFSQYRNVYKEVFKRTENGLALMWVMELPEWGLVGQAFVQLRSTDRKTADGKRRAYLHSFRVRPAWQGRGLGTRLMAVIEEELLERGFRELTLNVSLENEGALRLYKRLGYEVVSEIPGRWSYYDPEGVLRQVHEPGYRMIKRLGE
jgi:ribosomal protein S18 acetylase RimI-like enzyme